VLYQLSYVGGASTVADPLLALRWRCGILREVATAQAPVLVGREQELERVLGFFAVEDGPGKLLLEGDPGIGKTTLWHAGLDEARRRGFRVLEARPAAAERELSFAALGDLLSELADDIGGLPAPQRRALRIALLIDEVESDPPEQRTIAVAVTELLRRVSREAPLVVAVDDAHWLDAPSAGALDFSVRRLAGAAVRLFATSRAGGERVAFAESDRIEIGPLSADALGELVRTRLGVRLLRPVTRQLATASGGNPFYALELATELVRTGRTIEPGERLPIPTHLRGVVAGRLETLSPTARDAVLATAALAQPTALVVETVAGGTNAIAEAVSSGVLELHGDSLRFAHPLFAATVYEDAAQVERKAVHKRLAQVVTEPEERARQLAEAADGPDAAIATFLEAAAARAVARGAPDAGVRLAKLAADLTPAHRRNALHKRRLDGARYSYAAGDPKHAQELLEQHLEDAIAGRERAEVELELGRAVLATRGPAAATTHYERALSEVEGSDELELQALVLTELADVHLTDPRDDSDASARAVAVAEKVWNAELLAKALGIHGATLTWREEPVPPEYWERALEVEAGTGQRRWAGPACAYAFAKMFRLEYDEATRWFHEVADSMRRRDDPMLHSVLLMLGDIARNSGHWDEAGDYIDEAYDVVVQTGRQSAEPECLTAKARLAMLRGDVALARRLASEARDTFERIASSGEPPAPLDSPMLEGLVSSVFARSAAMCGDHAEAHELFVQQRELWGGAKVNEWVAETLADDVASLVALGRLEEAGRALDDLHEVRKSLPNDWRTADAVSARAEGGLAAAGGDFDGAIKALERSRELIENIGAPWPYELARTLLALGQVQRRARRKAAARATLEEALEIFERLPSRLWAEQTRTELDQISGRPSRSGALTPTEARVAEIVAAGRSNAEAAQELFMSPKTVEWNLSKIYKKLHVRSRAELAAKLAKTRQS
jgi:DNA-binding CsgD family transcriptional regulator